MIFSLKAKENELSKTIASFNVEAGVVKTWINFLEDTFKTGGSFSRHMMNVMKRKQSQTVLGEVATRLQVVAEEPSRWPERGCPIARPVTDVMLGWHCRFLCAPHV